MGWSYSWALPRLSSQLISIPDLDDCELKQVSLKRKETGVLGVKETMCITMINPIGIVSKEFEESHLFTKLQKMIVVARIFESKADDHSLVREIIKTQGFSSLRGKMGELVQPRTKGKGHGSTSRAFYARPKFVEHILGEGYSMPLA